MTITITIQLHDFMPAIGVLATVVGSYINYLIYKKQ